LGAGTGLVGIVAARLGAGRVVVTDGDEGVCDSLKSGLERNGVADVVSVKRLMWGEGEGKESNEGNEGERFDLVVGADVIYDGSTIPPFVAELVRLFRKNPSAKVVISTTIRNEDTFSLFRDSCAENSLLLSENTWTPPTPPIFYYPTDTPIRISHVTRESPE
jgi:predicted nicotinamide N-methyase